MTHQVKTAPLTSFKATDPAAGTFTAVVAVFGNVDLVGDRIIPGAFTSSLKAWQESGDPIPVIWSHRWEDPDMHVGAVTSASESPEGLLVTGALDLDHPVGAQVYRLLSSRRVKEFSFAYDVLDSRPGEGGVTELTDLSVIEVGPTLRGANPATSLLDVKAAPEAKAAAVLSDATEQESSPHLPDPPGLAPPPVDPAPPEVDPPPAPPLDPDPPVSGGPYAHPESVTTLITRLTLDQVLLDLDHPVPPFPEESHP